VKNFGGAVHISLLGIILQLLFGYFRNCLIRYLPLLRVQGADGCRDGVNNRSHVDLPSERSNPRFQQRDGLFKLDRAA
jgi:hypothetical protein